MEAAPERKLETEISCLHERSSDRNPFRSLQYSQHQSRERGRSSRSRSVSCLCVMLWMLLSQTQHNYTYMVQLCIYVHT